MSELDDRYERGQETRRMFGGGQISGGSSPGAWGHCAGLGKDTWRGTVRHHLEAAGADAGATGNDHAVVPYSYEPRGTVEAALEQRAERRTDAGPGRGVDHSRYLVRWSAGGHPGADTVQRGFLRSAGSSSRQPASTMPAKIPTACSSGATSSGAATWESPPRRGRPHRRKLRGNWVVLPENTTGERPGPGLGLISPAVASAL